MAQTQNELNLGSEANEILLNPRLPREDHATLCALAEHVQNNRNLKGHVWIATSGSTATSASRTKLVALSKTALRKSAEAVNRYLNGTSEDIWAQVLPQFHVGGLGIYLRAQLSGAKVISALKDFRWDVLNYHEALMSENCTLSALVPTQVYDLVTHKLRPPKSLRAIIVGGGALQPDLYRRARELGWPLLPSYGMTETASQIATASLKSLHDMDFPEMHVLDHAQVRKNSEGFLQVKAESLFTCYAQVSSDGFTSWDPKSDGWFTTEDQGDVNQGVLYIHGRNKDYVKIGGEGTNVAHLRSILESCAAKSNSNFVSQITLLDMPSDRLGSEIHVVSLLSEAETENIVQRYTEKVLPFEKPRKIHFVKEIPRTELGKILWAQLRSQL